MAGTETVRSALLGPGHDGDMRISPSLRRPSWLLEAQADVGQVRAERLGFDGLVGVERDGDATSPHRYLRWAWDP
jgi:hypothetical protein